MFRYITGRGSLMEYDRSLHRYSLCTFGEEGIWLRNHISTSRKIDTDRKLELNLEADWFGFLSEIRYQSKRRHMDPLGEIVCPRTCRLNKYLWQLLYMVRRTGFSKKADPNRWWIKS